MDFNNKKYNVIANGIEFEVNASRIIASWNNLAILAHERSAGHSFKFTDWLETLGLSEQDIQEIEQLASNGKIELEYSAMKFLERFE